MVDGPCGLSKVSVAVSVIWRKANMITLSLLRCPTPQKYLYKGLNVQLFALWSCGKEIGNNINLSNHRACSDQSVSKTSIRKNEKLIWEMCFRDT